MVTSIDNVLSLTNDVAVWHGFSQKLAEQPTPTDDDGYLVTTYPVARLFVAPECRGGDIYVYLRTNGGPVMIGWLTSGSVEFADDYAEMTLEYGEDHDEIAWVLDALRAEGFLD